MRLDGRTVLVRVPATSANLGPGFDSLGLALTLNDELAVTATRDPGVHVDVRGVGEGELPIDEHNLVAKTMLQTFDKLGVAAPGLRIKAMNSLPQGRGLGSSASATVSAIMAVKGLLSGAIDLSDDDVLAFATEFEGHPDNAAPAIFGGVTIAWSDADRHAHARTIAANPNIRCVVAIPDFEVSTSRARALQPRSVLLEDAVFNLSRTALLVAALSTDLRGLLEATEDRLHQQYRATAMPETARLVAGLRTRGHAAVVSGAGPSVLVLSDGDAAADRAKDACDELTGGVWRTEILGIPAMGATVEMH